MGIDNLYKDMEQYICGLYAQLSCACVLSNLVFFTLCQEIKIKCTNHKISTNLQKQKVCLQIELLIFYSYTSFGE